LCHLFEHCADGGCVAIAESALHRFEVNAFGGVEDGCWHTDLARVVADDVHVLVPYGNLHGHVVVTPFRHHRCSQLKDARVAGARGDEVDDHPRVEAGFHAQHHGFRGSDVVDGDQKIGHVFHTAPIAELADIERVPAKAHEDGAQPRNRLGIATGINHEIRVLGLRAGTADRTVDHGVTGLAQHTLRFFFI